MFIKRNFNIKSNVSHPFHLVKPSPWPFVTALAVLFFLFNFIFYMHNISFINLVINTNGNLVFDILLWFFSFLLLLISVNSWFRDIHLEAITGNHTLKVQDGLRLGMLLFIVSEIMFFFAFFWAFFHSSLSPSLAIGCIWPPEEISVLNAWGLPLLNTVLLLSSGVTITWAHRALLLNNTESGRKAGIVALTLTIAFGIVFTLCQIYEYATAAFSINSGIYGSIFYMATGFHGFHVLLGTIFLIVTLIRQIFYHFTTEHHVGFEAAAWYWHFVDVVWIFLYVMIYCWGS